MTKREAFSIATAVRQKAAQERADRLREQLEQDGCLKRAAHIVGLPYRTACRYRRLDA